MTLHYMSLHSKPFERIKSGEKVDELRLNDEKRQQIKVGDHIMFSKRSELVEKIEVEVIALTPYKNFNDLYDGLKDRYSKWSKADFVIGMHEYYSPEDEVKYGALEIGIRLI